MLGIPCVNDVYSNNPSVREKMEIVLEPSGRVNSARQTSTGQHLKTAMKGRMTGRGEVRKEISTTTVRKRASFFVAKKDVFLPLLPQDNFISNLMNKTRLNSGGMKTEAAPYDTISQQPVG